MRWRRQAPLANYAALAGASDCTSSPTFQFHTPHLRGRAMASKLTHVWVEVPFFSDALSKLPADVEVYLGQLGLVELENVMPAQVALASSGVRYNAELFRQLPNLRMVQRTGIGVDNVNLADATAHGVVVCTTPDGPTESTAEH